MAQLPDFPAYMQKKSRWYKDLGINFLISRVIQLMDLSAPALLHQRRIKSMTYYFNTGTFPERSQTVSSQPMLFATELSVAPAAAALPW